MINKECLQCDKLGYTCNICINLVHSEFGDLMRYDFYSDKGFSYPDETRLVLDFENKETETCLTFLALNAANIKIDIYQILSDLNSANLDINQIMSPYIMIDKIKFTLSSIMRDSKI